MDSWRSHITNSYGFRAMGLRPSSIQITGHLDELDSKNHSRPKL